jgi:hypothetical protein
MFSTTFGTPAASGSSLTPACWLGLCPVLLAHVQLIWALNRSKYPGDNHAIALLMGLMERVPRMLTTDNLGNLLDRLRFVVTH